MLRKAGASYCPIRRASNMLTQTTPLLEDEAITGEPVRVNKFSSIAGRIIQLEPSTITPGRQIVHPTSYSANTPKGDGGPNDADTTKTATSGTRTIVSGSDGTSYIVEASNGETSVDMEE